MKHRVGFLILVGLALGLSVSACSTSKKYDVELLNAATISEGATVNARGIEVGKVVGKKLKNNRALATIEVSNEHELTLGEGVCASLSGSALELRFVDGQKGGDGFVPACPVPGKSIIDSIKDSIEEAQAVAKERLEAVTKPNEAARDIGKKLGQEMREFGEGFGEGVGDFESAGEGVGKAASDFGKGIDKGVTKSQGGN